MPDSASNTIFTVPIAATVPAGAQLVMEVFTPDGTVAGNLLFMGSNADPESAPSYLSAGGVRDNDADDNGGDWVPEHAPRVQRQWQLRRRWNTNPEPDRDSRDTELRQRRRLRERQHRAQLAAAAALPM